MALPYSSATSGDKSLVEIQKLLRQFDCDKFGSMTDWGNGKLIVQFEYKAKTVSVECNFKGYAKAWLKENPWSSRRKLSETEYKKHAEEIGSVAVYSVLRDWIKSQITMIEADLMTFEELFLANIMLPNGIRVIEHIRNQKLIEG